MPPDTPLHLSVVDKGVLSMAILLDWVTPSNDATPGITEYQIVSLNVNKLWSCISYLLSCIHRSRSSSNQSGSKDDGECATLSPQAVPSADTQAIVAYG